MTMRHPLRFIVRDRDGHFYSAVGAHGPFVPTLARARFFSTPESAGNALARIRERDPRGNYTLVDADIEVDVEMMREGPPAEPAEEPAPPQAISQGHPQAELAPTQASALSGHACPTCGNFTLARNGTCLVCLTCGETTGCS